MRKMMLLVCEDQVVGRLRLGETGLLQAAASGVRAARDGEQVFYSAVGGVRIGITELVEEEREPRFARRAVGGDERRDGVGGSAHEPVGDHLELGVGGRTGAADGRLKMASGALDEVEPRSQTVVARGAVCYGLYILEAGLAVLKELQGAVARIYRTQWRAGACGATLDARISLGKRASGKK